jgi:hypothetical protein
MKLLRRTLVALAGLLLTEGAGRAQDFGFVWSEWETKGAARNGRRGSSSISMDMEYGPPT